MKKIELHCHTAPVSLCARHTAQEVVSRYKACGFDGVMLTNHFSPFYMDRHGVDYDRYLDDYIGAYHEMQRACRENGMQAYFGAEVTNFCPKFAPNVEKYGLDECKKNYGDYLIIGLTEKILRSAPVLFDLTLAEIKKFCDDNGVLLVQAHPFRVEQEHSLKDITLLHGLEMNANISYNPEEQKILEIAKEHNLIVTVGNDLHGAYSKINGAIYIPDEVNDSVGIADYLREVKIPPYELGITDPTFNVR